MQNRLRVKEAQLLQVLDVLQVLVADAAEQRSSTALTRDSGGEDENHMFWLLVVATVQQREQEIKSLYGKLLSSLYPHHQRELHGIQLLKAMCSPEAVENKVGGMRWCHTRVLCSAV